MRENVIEIGGLVARMNFRIETVDGEEEKAFIEADAGYALMEKLRLYAIGEYTTIFENEYSHVHYAELISINYQLKAKGVDIDMSISTDDSASIKLTFDTRSLEDKNAQKIALMREIIDFDPETENYLLKQLMNSSTK